MPPPPEPDVARFRLESRLPDAGLGEAWAAVDRARGDAPALVKLLGAGPPGDAADPRSLPALVERLQRATDPGVLQPWAWGEREGRAYLAHERFEGRSLATWLAGHRKARTRPGFATAQRLFRQVAAALESAGAGAPHGSLSPRSVLVRRESPGQYAVRVLDFGAAHLLVPPAGGHPAPAPYRAPEQLDDPARESPQADVFALAAVLAELLSPALAPSPDGPAAWAAAAREGAVRAKLGALRSDVPATVWDAVALALDVNPARRPERPVIFAALVERHWTKAGLWDKAPLTPEPDPPEAPPPAASPTLQGSTTRFASAPAPRPPTVVPPAPMPVAGPPPPLALVAPSVPPAPLAAPPAPSPAWSAPPARVSVTAWDHVDEPPLTLPIASPLDASATLALGASLTDDAPATLALGTSLPLDLAGEHTSLEVFMPPAHAAQGDVPFEDPSPTPRDGLPSVLDEDEGVTDYAANPAPHERPRRLRARTLGVDEPAGLAMLAPPATPDAVTTPSVRPAARAPDPDGTRMIQASWEQPPSDPVTLLVNPPAAPVPVVERTMAIDLSASGVMPSPALPPPSAPPWSSPGLAPHGWSPPPAPVTTTSPPEPARAWPAGWVIAGVVGAFALVALLVVLARS
ncbi:MAG: protein kinase [Polyangiales bacterium]